MRGNFGATSPERRAPPDGQDLPEPHGVAELPGLSPPIGVSRRARVFARPLASPPVSVFPRACAAAARPHPCCGRLDLSRALNTLELEERAHEEGDRMPVRSSYRAVTLGVRNSISLYVSQILPKSKKHRPAVCKKISN